MRALKRALKDCPRCDFRPSLNARVCSGCAHVFDDAAPVWIRNWVRDVARLVVRDTPGLGAKALREDLEARLMHHDELLAALEEDPTDRADPEGLLGTVRSGLRHLWTQVVGPDEERARKIRWAIQEALEDLEVPGAAGEEDTP